MYYCQEITAVKDTRNGCWQYCGTDGNNNSNSNSNNNRDNTRDNTDVADGHAVDGDGCNENSQNRSNPNNDEHNDQSTSEEEFPLYLLTSAGKVSMM